MVDIVTRPPVLPDWASAGDKVQPGSDELPVGWPNSPIPPSRQRFNWVLHHAVSMAHYLLQRGVPEWDAAENYPASAYVQRNGKTYQSLSANTNSDPATQTAIWTRWGFSQNEINNLITGSQGTGKVDMFASPTLPAGWIKANGAIVSRTTYAALFAAIGTTWGAGDGSTTFQLPDLRGYFLRVWDDGRGIDSGRALFSAQGDAIRNITGGFGAFEQYGGIGTIDGVFSGSVINASTGFIPNNTQTPVQQFTFDASTVVPTAPENRPLNIALLGAIKY